MLRPSASLCIADVDGTARLALLDGKIVKSVADKRIPATWEALVGTPIFAELPADIAQGEVIGDAASTRFMPPLLRSSKVICVGRNFPAHAEETGGGVGGHPSLFLRFPDAHAGHNQPIVRPTASECFDWEGELALVIGRTASHVPRSEAARYVTAYTCFGDHSIRDWQLHNAQVTPGKNFRASGAIGPAIVPTSSIDGLDDLRLTTRLNGEVMQDALLGEMVFGVAEVIEYVTKFTDLHPGDVIAMGTPSGIGGRRTPPLWMKPGDVIEVEIDGIGRLRNPVEAEGAPATTN